MRHARNHLNLQFGGLTLICLVIGGCSLYRSADRDDFNINGYNNRPSTSQALLESQFTQSGCEPMIARNDVTGLFSTDKLNLSSRVNHTGAIEACLIQPTSKPQDDDSKASEELMNHVVCSYTQESQANALMAELDTAPPASDVILSSEPISAQNPLDPTGSSKQNLFINCSFTLNPNADREQALSRVYSDGVILLERISDKQEN